MDTNILIPLEDSSSVLSQSFGELNRLAQGNGHQLIIHPSSYEDIERDKDLERKNIIKSRFEKYPQLENPPICDLGFPESSSNDSVDNQLLCAIYKNAVNLLVTEDRKLHKKAKQIGKSERVLYVQQAVELLRKLHERILYEHPNIQEISLYQIDINDPFFDSLREDYDVFDDWYSKASMEGRKAWVYKMGQNIVDALCIYKEEFGEVVTDDNILLKGKALKLCTFKVGEQARGRKIGELFLKAAFSYSTNNENEIENIYITLNPEKQEYLQYLLDDFGFKYFGKYKGDLVFVKEHPVESPKHELAPLEYNINYFPHYIWGEDVRKFIVPIQPQFHDLLFPENSIQRGLFGSDIGNGIKLAYLCHSRITKIRPADILLFYRSGDRRAITSLGVVERVETLKDADEIAQIVAKRTVYSFEDIEDMSLKMTKVILFRLVFHFLNDVSFDWLKRNFVVSGPIMSIQGISHESFSKIIQNYKM